MQPPLPHPSSRDPGFRQSEGEGVSLREGITTRTLQTSGQSVGALCLTSQSPRVLLKSWRCRDRQRIDTDLPEH